VWYYHGVIVYFNRIGVRLGVELTDSTFVTKRGLRVGDSLDRVIELYGRPRYAWAITPNRWTFLAQDSEDASHVIRVNLRADQVSRIYLGWEID
jgi:hypothetical protein